MFIFFLNKNSSKINNNFETSSSNLSVLELFIELNFNY